MDIIFAHCLFMWLLRSQSYPEIPKAMMNLKYPGAQQHLGREKYEKTT